MLTCTMVKKWEAKQILQIDDMCNQTDLDAIRAALIVAEQSGEPQPFDSEEFKQKMLAKHGACRD